MGIAADITAERIGISDERLAEFCRRWLIQRLEVFGSVLRDDFQPASDVDFLVTFENRAQWTLIDIERAKLELSQMTGRPVDLVERVAIEQSSNWIRRRKILENARCIYGF